MESLSGTSVWPQTLAGENFKALVYQRKLWTLVNNANNSWYILGHSSEQ